MESEFDAMIVAGIVLQTTLSSIPRIEEYLSSLPHARIIFVKKVPGNQKLYIVKAKLGGNRNGTEAGNLWA